VFLSKVKEKTRAYPFFNPWLSRSDRPIVGPISVSPTVGR
jgi:hypothetical protein